MNESLIRDYLYRQICRYEDDVTQLSNNVTFRKSDPLDHLEMIMAQTRLATAIKINQDIQFLLDNFSFR